MQITDLEAAFLRYLQDRRLEIQDLVAAAAVAAMTGFYLGEPAEGVVDEGGDMLLFQWGDVPRSQPPTFEYDVTRQLIAPDDEGDEAFWQLALTLSYSATPATAALGSGNQWCLDHASVGQFVADVTASPASVCFATQRPELVRVWLDRV